MHLLPLTRITWYEFMSDGELATTTDTSFTNNTCLELDLNCVSVLRLQIPFASSFCYLGLNDDFVLQAVAFLAFAFFPISCWPPLSRYGADVRNLEDTCNEATDSSGWAAVPVQAQAKLPLSHSVGAAEHG